MKTSHTPGPWHIQPSSSFDASYVLIKPIPGQVVAQVDKLPEMDANAALIAAAPDLLEALKFLDDNDRITCENADFEIPAGECPCCGCKARAAIAKATGE